MIVSSLQYPFFLAQRVFVGEKEQTFSSPAGVLLPFPPCPWGWEWISLEVGLALELSSAPPDDSSSHIGDGSSLPAN